MLKTLIKQVVPRRLWAPVKDLVFRLRSRKHERVALLVREATGNMVASGPFAGLRYTDESAWSVPSPNLVGSYESELHEDFENLIRAAPSVVIDVGSADGYYAVGLARRLTSSVVYAFDISQKAQKVCAMMAMLNGVADRVRIRGEATHEDLQQLCGAGSLLIVDCEGAELDLLRPDLAPALSRTNIVVEFHDFINPAISSTIFGRFMASHSITVHSATEKDPAKWPALDGFEPRDARIAVDERRPLTQEWAVLRPKGAE